MKAIYAMVALIASVLADGVDPNLYVVGTYVFEMMGRSHKLYVCDSDGIDAEPSKRTLYWSITDTVQNEYTIAVGRDSNGVENDGESKYVARSDMFRLYGAQTLQGYYEIVVDTANVVYTLRERFPELEDGQAGTEIWNEYQMVKISPAIVGNQDLEGYQCFHPLGNSIIQLPIPSISQSDYLEIDHGYRSNVLYPGPTEFDISACWKLENEFGDVLQAGHTYAFQLEWDLSLLIARFDNLNKNRNLRGCRVGSTFTVMVGPDLAIVSLQCEDRATGRTFLTHISEYVAKEDMMCPFELADFDDSEFAEDGVHNDKFDNISQPPQATRLFDPVKEGGSD